MKNRFDDKSKKIEILNFYWDLVVNYNSKLLVLKEV